MVRLEFPGTIPASSGFKKYLPLGRAKTIQITIKPRVAANAAKVEIGWSRSFCGLRTLFRRLLVKSLTVWSRSTKCFFTIFGAASVIRVTSEVDWTAVGVDLVEEFELGT